MDAAPSTDSKKRTLGRMLAAELQGKLSSKQDFFVYLDKHRKCLSLLFLILTTVQFYLPDEGSVNKDFLKLVLAEKKQLLKKQEVNYITVPHYDEISVKALWPDLKKDGEFMQYFSSVYPKGRGPPREYFFNILNTIKPDYLQQLLDHANKMRMAADGYNQQNQSI